MNWIMENLSTIIVGALLLAAVVLAIRSVIKDHKNHKCVGGCPGCDCSSCHCTHTPQKAEKIK